MGTGGALRKKRAELKMGKWCVHRLLGTDFLAHPREILIRWNSGIFLWCAPGLYTTFYPLAKCHFFDILSSRQTIHFRLTFFLIQSQPSFDSIFKKLPRNIRHHFISEIIFYGSTIHKHMLGKHTTLRDM